MATQHDPQSDPSRSQRRTTGSVWTTNRYKAWYWVAAFVVIVVILILLAY